MNLKKKPGNCSAVFLSITFIIFIIMVKHTHYRKLEKI